jgi:fucose 4-O-acetylase-like acetyltransferase
MYQLEDIKPAQARIIYADFLKGALIFLVVFGHCIQNFSCMADGECFSNSKIAGLIYSFHMPLFFAISGYFSFVSMRKYLLVKQFTVKRIFPLLIPFLTFVVFDWIIIQSSFRIISIYWFVKDLIIFLCLTFVLKKLKADKMCVFLIISFLMMALPSNSIAGLGKFYLFFCTGYLLNRMDIQKCCRICRKQIWLILVTCIVLYCIVLYCYNNTFFFGSKILSSEQFFHTVLSFGLAFGLCILFAVGIYYYISKRQNVLINIFTEIGKYTLAIYLIHFLLLEIHRHYLHSIVFFKNYVVLQIFTAIILILLICGIIKLIEKNTYTRYVLLGKK